MLFYGQVHIFMFLVLTCSFPFWQLPSAPSRPPRPKVRAPSMQSEPLAGPYLCAPPPRSVVVGVSFHFVPFSFGFISFRLVIPLGCSVWLFRLVIPFDRSVSFRSDAIRFVPVRSIPAHSGPSRSVSFHVDIDFGRRASAEKLEKLRKNWKPHGGFMQAGVCSRITRIP